MSQATLLGSGGGGSTTAITYTDLSKQTASSSSAIAFTGFLNVKYSYYVLAIRNVIPSNNATQLLMQWSTNAGSTYIATAYQWAQVYANSSGGFGSNENSNDTSMRIQDAMNNNGTATLNCDIKLYNLGSTSVSPIFRNDGALIDSGNFFGLSLSTGGLTGVNNINALKMFMSAGTISSGTFTLYGVQES